MGVERINNTLLHIARGSGGSEQERRPTESIETVKDKGNVIGCLPDMKDGRN